MSQPTVTFVLPDKVGGVVNIIDGLLRHRQPDTFRYGAVLTHNPLSSDTRFGGVLPGDWQRTVEFRSPVENFVSVLRRVRQAVPRGAGVLVANDLLELAMASRFETGKTVVQVLHGDHDYYYDLAVRHQHAVDAFVTYGRVMQRTLQARLPHRAADVHLLPYGIPLARAARHAVDGPLRLYVAGRLEHGQKGVFDLPAIDEVLAARGVDARWTVVGGGPDEAELRRRWTSGRATFVGAVSRDEVVARATNQDVFVLPTRYEGVPVSLLEAMSVGLVPVASDIESGVREVVEHQRTGVLVPVGDIGAFAEAIAALDRDRSRLNAMGHAARAHVAAQHDVRTCTDAYQQLFAGFNTLRRPRTGTSQPYGSTLDRPWIPNLAVRSVRTAIRLAKGLPY